MLRRIYLALALTGIAFLAIGVYRFACALLYAWVGGPITDPAYISNWTLLPALLAVLAIPKPVRAVLSDYVEEISVTLFLFLEKRVQPFIERVFYD
ncbi:MAG: hypothetical protein KGL39_33580 [Patescibacteria group bacterium]|nr:hypothetical protein [Patescibacteria group bacterium]